jgi:hypothetical protein
MRNRLLGVANVDFKRKETSEAMASQKSLWLLRPACKPRSVRQPIGAAAIIYLGHALPHGSSSLPDAQSGRAAHCPKGFASAWPCSRWGLPGRWHRCQRRWSLTPPFHPDRNRNRVRRLFSVAHPRDLPARALPGTVLSGARTFLRHMPAIARPVQQLPPSYRGQVRTSIKIALTMY